MLGLFYCEREIIHIDILETLGYTIAIRHTCEFTVIFIFKYIIIIFNFIVIFKYVIISIFNVCKIKNIYHIIKKQKGTNSILCGTH